MQYLTEEEIKELQLQLLIDFDAYCEKHGLKYCLDAGTLLGAVRHKGFIPWDDDIDVIMPRPDYERFYELTKTEPVAENIEARCNRNCETYSTPIIKLMDNRTDGHEEHLADEIMSGVWIDVFPMDGVPENPQLREAHIKRIMKLFKRLEYASRPLKFTSNPLKMAKRLAIYLGYHHFGYKKLADQLDVLAQKYKYEDCDDIGLLAFGRCPIISKKDYEETILLPFEGHEFKAPKNYDKYLTILFGDYMTPPPPEQQISAHFYKAWWKDGKKPE